LYAAIGTHKAEVIEALRQRERRHLAAKSLKLSDRGLMCAVCKKIDRCYSDPAGTSVCSACAELRVLGCACFAVLVGTGESTEARSGACLSCGGSWELHGRPEPRYWHRVSDLDGIELVRTITSLL
jgi:hypothetical protein